MFSLMAVSITTITTAGVSGGGGGNVKNYAETELGKSGQHQGLKELP